jgi:ABC-type glycerol-3-phosphate transport system substrate-binding protein
MDSQSKKTLFQTIILIIFGFAAIVAIGIFAANKGSVSKKDPSQATGTVRIWGTLPSEPMKNMFSILEQNNKDLRIVYEQKPLNTFENDLVHALASGIGPDIFMVTPETVLSNRSRLTAIPYSSLSSTDFKNSFVNQANLFLFPEGIIALPMFLDPLVLYINQDILTQSFVVNEPKTWEDIISLNSSLTKLTDSGQINQAMIGMGAFDNVLHADGIIKTLLLQSNNILTGFLPSGNRVIVRPNTGGTDVFRFYQGFSDSESDFYTWNTAQGSDRDSFVAGKTAFYIGPASEIPLIRTKNPNLNFNISMMPMPAEGGRKTMYAQMTGFGVSKVSPNQTTAFAVLGMITDPSLTQTILNTTWLAPVHRSLLNTLPANDPTRAIVYKSAIISYAFLTPDNIKTNESLQRNINETLSGLIIPETAYANWVSDLTVFLEELQRDIS